MKSEFNINYLDKLDELEFTILDILADVPFIRPFFLIFKKTRLVKHYKIYNVFKKDLLEKLQIQKIVS